jgi:hypothetical protein
MSTPSPSSLSTLQTINDSLLDQLSSLKSRLTSSLASLKSKKEECDRLRALCEEKGVDHGCVPVVGCVEDGEGDSGGEGTCAHARLAVPDETSGHSSGHSSSHTHSRSSSITHNLASHLLSALKLTSPAPPPESLPHPPSTESVTVPLPVPAANHALVDNCGETKEGVDGDGGASRDGDGANTNNNSVTFSENLATEFSSDTHPSSPSSPSSRSHSYNESESSLNSCNNSHPPSLPSRNVPSLHFTNVNSANLPLMAAAAAAVSPVRTTLPNLHNLPEPEHAVNYSTIRRRYTDLVRGPNADTEQIFDANATLFQQTFEVEWVEDSPGFRHKLAAVDENVEGLRKHMLRLVEICRNYGTAGNEFNEVGRTFANEMMHLQGESWFTRLGDLAPALIRFGETIDEIQNYREALLFSLETTFSQPMEAFVKREVKEVKKKRIELQSSLLDYEANLSKLGMLKNNEKEEVITHLTNIVATSKRRFELNRFDLVYLLNQLEIKKKFQLVERICSGLYANLGFFHQCHTLVANREPAMRELQSQLQNARRDYAKTETLWNAKRIQIDIELSNGVFPRPTNPKLDIMHSRPTSFNQSSKNDTAGRHCEGVSGVSSNVDDVNNGGDDDNDDDGDGDGDDDVREHDQEVSLAKAALENSISNPNPNANRPKSQSTPPRLSDFEASIGIIKHGYLWKRSSNVKRDWKRRWFIIQGGKLKYTRQEESDVQPPVTVCDIMLCTVRENNKPQDTRFTFEIVSPQNRTYTLKAENYIDKQEWIDAIREQTESLLVSGAAHNDDDDDDYDHEDNNDENGEKRKARANNRTGGSRLPSGVTSLGVPSPDIVKEIRARNNTCVDCGKENPDWVSINNGVLMCIQCSGIHRSLGVHVSKVRSITLDNWSLPMLDLLKGLGNDVFNQVWEARPSKLNKKVNKSSARSEAEGYIRAKYRDKAFVAVGEGVDVNVNLWNSCKHGDVISVMKFLAWGADYDFVNAHEKGASCLHAVVASNPATALECIELLLVNGANVNAVDSEENSVLDVAVAAGRNDVIAFLVAKMENNL